MAQYASLGEKNMLKCMIACISLVLGFSSTILAAGSDVQEIFIDQPSEYDICVSTSAITQMDPDSTVLYGRTAIYLQNQATSDIRCSTVSTELSATSGWIVSKNGGTYALGMLANTRTSATRLSVYCISTSTTACSKVRVLQGK